jgi:plasmid stability protein
MVTLHLQISDELYEALRRCARQHHRSISAEVISVLERTVPTQTELEARQELLRKLQRIHSKAKGKRRLFVAVEAMQREDRER